MQPTNPIKISVLATGDLLLDGLPVSLAELERALQEGAQNNSAAWYYRESAGAEPEGGEPPAVALQVMKLIIGHRLPVRLSSRPDFSDSVTSSTDTSSPVTSSSVSSSPVSSSPITSAAPAPVLEQLFQAIRARAAQGKLVIMRTDGRQLALPALPKSATSAEAVASVERMLPSSVKRNVVAVGDTSWAMASPPDVRAANRAIPFFGLLMGFSTIGHAVWVFDGSTAALLAAGCREADVMIVDSRRAATFPADWKEGVARAMRGPQILVYDAATSQFRKA